MARSLHFHRHLCWTFVVLATVIGLAIANEGEEQQVENETQQASLSVSVQGQTTLTVGNASAFVAEENAAIGVQKAIAAKAGVDETAVTVLLSVAARRLQGRKLQGTSVLAQFEITSTAASQEEASSQGAVLVATLQGIDTSELASAITTEIQSLTGQTVTVSVAALNLAEPVIAGAPEQPTGYVQTSGTSQICGDGTVWPSMEAMEIKLMSPTTLALDINDAYLQSFHAYHPLKCHAMDPDGTQLFGGLRILGQACQLNNPDLASCFRKSEFPFPLPPNSNTMKIDLWATPESGGLAYSDPVDTTKFQPFPASRPSAETPGVLSLEVCTKTQGCTPGTGLCVPSFRLIALRPNAKASPDDQWNGTAHLPVDGFWDQIFEWEEPSATPLFGPYPHCPEDDAGRALPCDGNEILKMKMDKMSISHVTIGDDGSVSMGISYTVEWADRFAVHPCTIDLFQIRTRGKQHTVQSNDYWTPSFSIHNPAKDDRVISASSKLGVNLGFGQPVKANIGGRDEVPWPKQLVLSRSYSVELYPSFNMQWDQYPMDEQTVSIVFSERNLEPGLVEYDENMIFDSTKIDVGDAWTLKSASCEPTVDEGDRASLKISVTVARNPKGKMYSLIIPVITVAVMDVAFTGLVDFTDTAGVFLTHGVLIGVGVQLINPSNLGFPPTVPGMPFIQSFMLMLLIGALKTAFLLALRLIWSRKITILDSQLSELKSAAEEQNSFGVENVKDQEEKDADFRKYKEQVREKEVLEKLLQKYDLFIRASVPLWYIISWLVVAIDYGVL